MNATHQVASSSAAQLAALSLKNQLDAYGASCTAGCIQAMDTVPAFFCSTFEDNVKLGNFCGCLVPDSAFLWKFCGSILPDSEFEDHWGTTLVTRPVFMP